MLDTFTISFIYYMIKSNGPIMHPWGMPYVIFI